MFKLACVLTTPATDSQTDYGSRAITILVTRDLSSTDMCVHKKGWMHVCMHYKRIFV